MHTRGRPHGAYGVAARMRAGGRGGPRAATQAAGGRSPHGASTRVAQPIRLQAAPRSGDPAPCDSARVWERAASPPPARRPPPRAGRGPRRRRQRSPPPGRAAIAGDRTREAIGRAGAHAAGGLGRAKRPLGMQRGKKSPMGKKAPLLGRLSSVLVVRRVLGVVRVGLLWLLCCHAGRGLRGP